METALVDFEKQAAAFRAKNKVEGFRLTNKPLISEVLEQWLDNSNLSRTKTINTYASHIRRFIKFGGNELIDAITKLDGNSYIQHLVNSGLAHSALETAMAAMLGLLHFAEESGYVEFNSFSGLRLKSKRKPPRRRALLSPTQLHKLFQLSVKDRGIQKS